MIKQSLVSTINKLKPNNTLVSDEQLIIQTQAGEKNAFEQIMRRYNQRLFRIARSILKDDTEALDIVQETYVKAYFQLDQYRGPTKFGSWLSRIATNEALGRLRSSKYITYDFDDPEYEFDMESCEPEPLNYLANQQLRELLENAIDQLPLHYRSVYVLRAIQKLSTSETAITLDISEDTVKKRFSRARKNLQKIFESHLQSAELSVFEFAGERCDLIVKNVLEKLHKKLS